MTAASARDFGPKPELAWLPVEALYVDHRYQRTLESKRSVGLINRMKEEFHWPAFGALLVAPENAPQGRRYAVVDGQHRLTVAAALGFAEVPCVIIAARTIEEQAAAFLRLNKERVVVNPFAAYHASARAGNASAVAVAKACAAAGVDIPKYQLTAEHIKPNQTLAIGTIEKAVKEHGVELVVAVLRSIREALPEERALRAHIIRGAVDCFAGDQRVRSDAVITQLRQWGYLGFEEQIWSYQAAGGAKWQAVSRCLHEALFPKAKAVPAKPTSGVMVRDIPRPAVGIAGKTVAPDPTRPFVSAFEQPVRPPKSVRR